jgi:hypothetical protein
MRQNTTFTKGKITRLIVAYRQSQQIYLPEANMSTLLQSTDMSSNNAVGRRHGCAGRSWPGSSGTGGVGGALEARATRRRTPTETEAAACWGCSPAWRRAGRSCSGSSGTGDGGGALETCATRRRTPSETEAACWGCTPAWRACSPAKQDVGKDDSAACTLECQACTPVWRRGRGTGEGSRACSPAKGNAVRGSVACTLAWQACTPGSRACNLETRIAATASGACTPGTPTGSRACNPAATSTRETTETTDSRTSCRHGCRRRSRAGVLPRTGSSTTRRRRIWTRGRGASSPSPLMVESGGRDW